jgi:DNA-binding beta-propeller fold protein YncE
VTLGYEVTQDLETENTIAAVFNFKSTDGSKLDPATQTVTQFLRYRKKGDFSKYRYVACDTKGTTAHVDNFQPYLGDISAITNLSKKNDGASGNDATFWDSKLTDSVTAEGHFFEVSTDSGANFARKNADGSAQAQCIAKMQIPKFNDGSANFVGEDILGEYDIELGLRIQQEG